MNIFKWFFNLITRKRESTFIPDPNVAKRALCVAINDYPSVSNRLQGCINDAMAWSSLLKDKYGFQVITLFDSQATINNVKNELVNLVNISQPGDILAFTYSGHGTYVADKSGDEIDGRDEALCLYDQFLIDDQIREILDALKDGVKMTIISDSCYSGSVTRAVLGEDNKSKKNRPRYMPPENENIVAMLRSPKKRIFKSASSEENMKEVLISGCSDKQTSMDAYFNGKYFGAMSYYATKVLNDNVGITYNDFYAKLKEYLPSAEYPQSPQLEGKAENKARVMFA